jgi:ZIP family zinc transporter
MIYLVFTELLPEGLEHGEGLSNGGYPEIALGLLASFGVMVPLAFP